MFIGIFSIVSLSLNIEYGFTGLANFGKVAFFMIGAYTSALALDLGLPYLLCAVLAIALAAVAGYLVSLPALRLREDYLAIVTLAVGEVLRLVIKNEAWIAGGVMGIMVQPVIRFPPGVPHRFEILAYIALVYAALAACYVLAQLVANSPYGRVLRAIREDDLATDVLGKDVFRYKAQAFMFGSGMAGLAGGLFAHYFRYIDPYVFDPMLTFTIWVMVILGGPANNLGSIMGAALVESLERGARIVKDYLPLPFDVHNVRIIMIGLLMILVVMYKPEGLLRESRVRTPASEVAG